ncbi:MAG: hypothetical protein O2829_08660 [Bacteroidetes bacterium]|nr:hypothetical protein [Bacteroidota bacterium]
MNYVDIILYASYVLIAFGAVSSIVLPLIKSLDDPKSLLKSGLGVVAILVVFCICYVLSSNEVLPKFEGEPFNLTPGTSQMVGGLMYTTYLLVCIAIGGIVITEINKAVK